MPDVRLPGRIIRNVPKGTTKSELMRRVRLMDEKNRSPRVRSFENRKDLIQRGKGESLMRGLQTEVEQGQLSQEEASVLAAGEVGGKAKNFISENRVPIAATAAGMAIPGGQAVAGVRAGLLMADDRDWEN